MAIMGAMPPYPFTRNGERRKGKGDRHGGDSPTSLYGSRKVCGGQKASAKWPAAVFICRAGIFSLLIFHSDAILILFNNIIIGGYLWLLIKTHPAKAGS